MKKVKIACLLVCLLLFAVGARAQNKARMLADGTNYTSQRGAGTSSGGGGCPPAGTTNSLQKNNGAGDCASTATSDTGSAVNVDEDLHPKGPNPYYDLTRVGLYTGSGGGITCSITGGTNTATCPGGVGDFAVGHGIEIPLAGPASGFNAWGVTTITAFSRTGNVAKYSQTGGTPMLGVGQTVTITGMSDSSFNGIFTVTANDGDFFHFYAANPGSDVSTTLSTGTATLASPAVVVTPQGMTGTTTYAYKIVQRDYNGALSVASPAGTSTTSAATLGPNAVTVTSCSRTSGLTTCTTSSPHNFQRWADVDVEGTSSTQVNGAHIIYSVPTSTTFTFWQASFVDGSVATGGTATVVAKNLIQWNMTAIVVLQSIVYRSINGRAYSIVGIVEGMDGAFVDWGLSAPVPPSYIPATPPLSTTNGILSTAITAISGTTLALAANASNTATNQSALHDNSPIVLLGCAALPANGGGDLLIPATNPISNVQFNSPLDLRSCGNKQVTLTFASRINLNDPLILKAAGTIVRAAPGGQLAGNQFQSYLSTTISGNAYPLIYVVPGSFGPNTLTNLSMLCLQAYQSCVVQDQDGGGGGVANIHYDNDYFTGNGGAMPFIMRSGGFNSWFKDGGFAINHISGPGWGVPAALQLAIPNALSGTDTTGTGNGWQIAGLMEFNKSTFLGGGIEFNDWGTTPVGQPGNMTFITPLMESLYTPFISAHLTGAGSSLLGVTIDKLSYSDFRSGQSTPVISFAGNYRIGRIVSTFSSCATTNQPLFEGSINGGLEVWDNGCVVGAATAIVHKLINGFAGGNTTQYQSSNIALSGTGKAFFVMDLPTAPSLAVSAGGSVAVGTNCYAIFAYDKDGGTTTDGTQVCTTTTLGNQTVTITRPTLPGNAVGWNVTYYPSGGGSGYLACSEIPLTTTTYAHSSAGGGCGNSFNNVNTAGKANIGPSGISGLQFTTNQMDVIDTAVSKPSALFGRVSYHANSLQCTNSDGSTCLPGTGTTITVCSGSQSLGTNAIASGAAASTVTITCTGLLATDNIMLDFNGSPLAVTGYVPSSSGMLTILKWPTANTINVSVVNNTASSITPGAITLNYRVVR
jgi:hypothetical protein